MAKKAWLTERFADGLVFKKGNVWGKCFIEYIPAENAWALVKADGYRYIDCLWVVANLKDKVMIACYWRNALAIAAGRESWGW